ALDRKPYRLQRGGLNHLPPEIFETLDVKGKEKRRITQSPVASVVQPGGGRFKNAVAHNSIQLSYRMEGRETVVLYELINRKLAFRCGIRVYVTEHKRRSEMGRQ